MSRELSFWIIEDHQLFIDELKGDTNLGEYLDPSITNKLEQNPESFTPEDLSDIQFAYEDAYGFDNAVVKQYEFYKKRGVVYLMSLANKSDIQVFLNFIIDTEEQTQIDILETYFSNGEPDSGHILDREELKKIVENGHSTNSLGSIKPLIECLIFDYDQSKIYVLDSF